MKFFVISQLCPPTSPKSHEELLSAHPLTPEYRPKEKMFEHGYDSKVVVSSSLTSLKVSNRLDVPVGKNKVFPEMNKKVVAALGDLLDARDEKFKGNKFWCHFRFGGYREMAIYVLMLMKKGKPKIGHIRRDFLHIIMRKAAKKLDSKSRSRCFNLSGFYIYHLDEVLKIYSDNWSPLVEEMENQIVEENFLEEHDIREIFFYTCVHAMQDTYDSLETVFHECCFTNSPHIVMAQIHTATLFKSERGDVILTDYSDLRKLLRECVGRRFEKHWTFDNWLISGCGGFA